MKSTNESRPKSQSIEELRALVSRLEKEVGGAQLQDVRTNGDLVLMDLYGKGPWTLVLDPRPARPQLLVFAEDLELSGFQKVPKPLTLFLKSHAKNLALAEVFLHEDRGRVVEIVFRNRSQEARLEFSLVPHFSNLVAFAAGKKIAWSKPKELPPAPLSLGGGGRDFTSSAEAPPTWEERASTFLEDWNKKKSPSIPKGPASKDDLHRTLEKKELAVQKLEASLSSAEEERWIRFGEELKVQETPSAEFAELWDPKLSRAGNRDRAFQRAKDLRRKREGTRQRLDALKLEIEQLKTGELPATSEGPRRGTETLRKTGSEGSTLGLTSGAQAVIGRSAADNLALLRRARGWDLWVHLHNEPSAHAVIFREKNQTVSDGDLEKVGVWIQRRSRRGRKGFVGEPFEIVVVECRFVRPVKGDRLGRVTYTNPRILRFRGEQPRVKG